MIMDKKLLGAVALTTFVVSIIASIVTSSITGNFIWVNKQTTGTNRVYTVNEMDAMINSISSNISVLQSGVILDVLKVKTIFNDTTGYTQDNVEFQDIETGLAYKSLSDREGHGTFTYKGKSYSIVYVNDVAKEDDEYVTLENTRQTAKKNGILLFFR